MSSSESLFTAVAKRTVCQSVLPSILYDYVIFMEGWIKSGVGDYIHANSNRSMFVERE